MIAADPVVQKQAIQIFNGVTGQDVNELQIDSKDTFKDFHELTWCSEKEFPNDVEYVRKSLVSQEVALAVKEKDAALDQIINLRFEIGGMKAIIKEQRAEIQELKTALMDLVSWS